MEIKLNLSTLDACRHFAEDVYDSCKDKYQSRKQNNKELIINQITEGKFAEWGVYFYYEAAGIQCSCPDHVIYDKKRKNFDADLKLNKHNIHVKSQNSESIKRYGKSWLFQLEDPLFSKATDKDIVIFCSVNLKDLTVKIEYKNKFNKLVFSKPKLKKFLGIKLAVYLEEQDGYKCL